MKPLGKALVGLLALCFFIARPSFAQPTIHKEDIRADISPALRKQIEGLYSAKAKGRGDAAHALGKMGAQAAPAVPFLISMLNDAEHYEAPIGESGKAGKTSPGEAAAAALAQIGKPAVGPLIEALGPSAEFAIILPKLGAKGFETREEATKAII
ncbi:MAG: hypothetical protein QGD94_10890, partial [Planctomycetia bacterium]|nr:hypothetical protein [Planctomycetia bacterium]